MFTTNIIHTEKRRCTPSAAVALRALHRRPCPRFLCLLLQEEDLRPHFLGFNDHGKENVFPRGSRRGHSTAERHAQRTRYNAIHNRPKSLLRVRAHFDESVDETTGARFVVVV